MVIDQGLRDDDSRARGSMAKTHAAAGGLKARIVHHAVVPRERNITPCGYSATAIGVDYAYYM